MYDLVFSCSKFKVIVRPFELGGKTIVSFDYVMALSNNSDLPGFSVPGKSLKIPAYDKPELLVPGR